VCSILYTFDFMNIQDMLFYIVIKSYLVTISISSLPITPKWPICIFQKQYFFWQNKKPIVLISIYNLFKIIYGYKISQHYLITVISQLVYLIAIYNIRSIVWGFIKIWVRWKCTLWRYVARILVKKVKRMNFHKIYPWKDFFIFIFFT